MFACPRIAVMALPKTREFHPAFEEYCVSIWELNEDGIEVIQARIAERLRVSRPAVSEMIRRMEQEGLITVGEEIELTPRGLQLAEIVVRRHRLAERFLTDILELPWADVHEEAGKWEHIISDAVEAALVRVLGDPTTCPHGNPIPGAGYERPDMKPLAQIEVGNCFTINRIPEELEFEPGLLDYLEENELLPGNCGVVTNVSPSGTSTIEMKGRHIGLESFTAERILVLPEICDGDGHCSHHGRDDTAA